ncbi:hypothetical protein AVEN_238793-1, partial [Araneus ventricosus]
VSSASVLATPKPTAAGHLLPPVVQWLGHESTDCTAVEKCVNCDGKHTSFSRSCSKWKVEKEVVATKYKHNISFPETRPLRGTSSLGVTGFTTPRYPSVLSPSVYFSP